MDDFVISNLQEARNEWCSRLVSLFTPLIEEGLKSLFDEAWKMCTPARLVQRFPRFVWHFGGKRRKTKPWRY